MHFQHFYQSDATHVRMLIFKDRKKCKKVDSKSIVNRPIQFPNKHGACFFRILKNRCVKRPTLLSMCPPPYSAFAKSDYFLNKKNKQQTNMKDRFCILFWSVRTIDCGIRRNGPPPTLFPFWSVETAEMKGKPLFRYPLNRSADSVNNYWKTVSKKVELVCQWKKGPKTLMN